MTIEQLREFAARARAAQREVDAILARHGVRVCYYPCRVCGRPVAVKPGEASPGVCIDHEDPELPTGLGCPECLHPTSHFRDCSRAD